MLCVSKRSMVLTSSKFTGLQHMLNIIVVFPDDLVKTDSAGKSEAFFFSFHFKGNKLLASYVYTYASAMY